MKFSSCIPLLLLALALQFLGGCARPAEGPDPWEKNNRAIYKFDDDLDRVLLKPLADGYVKVVPKFVRTGLNNGFNNLGYFEVILNDYLQAKWDQGAHDSGRMIVNSTVGIAGFFDVATPIGLPSHDNDFGITLGKWGVKPGPYVVLPLFGPSTCRDIAAIPVGIFCNPLTYVHMGWYVSLSLDAVNAIESRAEYQRYFKFRSAASVDEYVFTREAYLEYRENKVRDGKPSNAPSIYDEDDDSTTTAPATAPATAPSTSTAPATRP
jgi:phospholipid-binding lipoprotein MlaA